MNQLPTRRHRRPQFKLKALLVVVLVSAMALSRLAVKMDGARHQEEVVQEIVRLKGGVFYDWDNWAARGEARPSPSWLRSVFGDDFFDKVVEVSLGGATIDDAALESVSRLRDLRALNLWDTTVTHEGLRALGELQHLERLFLRSDSVTDGDLKHVTDLPSLRSLSLCQCNRITDAGVTRIGKITKLEYPGQTHTKVLTGQGLARGSWRSSLPFGDAWRCFPCHPSALAG